MDVLNKIIKFSILFIGLLLQGIIFSLLLYGNYSVLAQDYNDYSNYNKNGYGIYVYDDDTYNPYDEYYYQDYYNEKEDNNGYFPDIFDILLKCPEGTINVGAIVTDRIFCDIVPPPTTQPPTTQTIITVNKTTTCDPERLGQEVCDNIPDAKIMALGNNTNPSLFLESQTPIDITLEEGTYSIMEKDMITGFEKCPPPFETGQDLPQFGSDVFICALLDEECMGTVVNNGESLICNIDNVVFKAGSDDIIVTNFFNFDTTEGGDTVSILMGNKDGAFTPAGTHKVGNVPTSVVVGDFNNDSNLDAVVGNDGGDVSILLGTGNISFNSDGSSQITFTSGGKINVGNNPVNSIAVGDFNGDLDLDFVVAANDQNINTLLGNGDGTFTSSGNTPIEGTTPISVAVGDFNTDSNLDVVTANLDSNNLSVLLGNGDGTFTFSGNFNTCNSPGSVAVGDFNTDSNIDTVTACFNGHIFTHLGNGDGTLTSSQNIQVGNELESVAVGDFNTDSNLDIVTGNIGDIDESDSLIVLLGNGEGIFAVFSNIDMEQFDPKFIATGFFNQDSNLDIAVANEFAITVSILLGNGDGTLNLTQVIPILQGPFSLAVGNFN